jgi:hypothetical protein
VGRLCVVAVVLLAACGRAAFDPIEPDATDDARDSGLGGVPCLADPCPSGSAFCSNFETEQPPSFSPWSEVEELTFGHAPAGPGSKLTITDSPACNLHSLSARVVGDQQFVQLFADLAPRPPTVFVRSMMYVPSTDPDTSIDAMGIGDLDARYLLLDLSSAGTIDVHSTEPIDGLVTPAPVFSRDRWTCFEMAITLGSPTGHVTVWVDDAMVIDGDGATENTPGALGYAIVGVSTGFLGDQVIYYDDFAVSASRIGCT